VLTSNDAAQRGGCALGAGRSQALNKKKKLQQKRWENRKLRKEGKRQLYLRSASELPKGRLFGGGRRLHGKGRRKTIGRLTKRLGFFQVAN